METPSNCGNPAEEILTVAARIDADLIVLGDRNDHRSLLLGSVSQVVMLDAVRPAAITGDTANT